jgi:hypothetical protein
MRCLMNVYFCLLVPLSLAATAGAATRSEYLNKAPPAV